MKWHMTTAVFSLSTSITGAEVERFSSVLAE